MYIQKDMERERPIVSIGIPVFNGENHLTEALDSILSQTYTNFELIISDNASTDKTQEICLSYAKRDKRIRYYCNERNIGAAPNFNRTFRLARGRYFKWAAHDDIIAPNYLAKCIEVLEREPSIVLCHSAVQLIDTSSRKIAEVDEKLKLHHVSSQRPPERFADLILIPHYCFDVFGVIRTSELAKTPLIASHIGSDRNLLAELGLLGRFYHVPDPMFFSRDHPHRSIQAMSLHARGEWFDIANRERLMLPRWSLFFEYGCAVRRARLSWLERLGCYRHMATWLRLYGKGLAKDLLVATNQVANPRFKLHNV